MGLRVGVSGATGVVGEMLLEILAERRFPVDELRVFASPRSVGRQVAWGGSEVTVEALEGGRFDGLDLVLNATSSELAREWVPRMVEAGAVVVDNSSAYRMDPDVPLVIPEINREAIGAHRGIVANMNCTTSTALMAVAPLHREFGVRAVISSSYQSVSGTGRDAMLEVLDQNRKAIDQIEALRGREPLDVPAPRVYPHPLAFNLFPQCETFPDGADTSTEESKMRAEMRKILGAPDLAVHATAVRVPVLVGHSVSLSVALDRPATPDEARASIADFPGTEIVDEPSAGRYPTPLQAAGRDEVLVGRVRANAVLTNGLSLFACGDNLRKGAALNAVQIAEALFTPAGGR